MATKEEIISGMERLIVEARRLSTALSEDQWALVVDLDGWKSKEVLAHVAGVGTLVLPMVNGFSTAPAGSDALAAVDIDQMNAGLVGARASKSATELADEIEAAYRGAIEFVKGADDELMAKRVIVRGYKDVPLSDIAIRMVVLHGLAHIYSVYASVMNA